MKGTKAIAYPARALSQLDLYVYVVDLICASLQWMTTTTTTRERDKTIITTTLSTNRSEENRFVYSCNNSASHGSDRVTQTFPTRLPNISLRSIIPRLDIVFSSPVCCSWIISREYYPNQVCYLIHRLISKLRRERERKTKKIH